MGKTGIEWTDETWPVTRGCEQVSPGCKHCYAKHMAARIIRMGKGKPTKYDGLVRLTARGEPQWTGAARFCPEELATPLRKRGGRRIFVSSMSDLFHDDITNEQIAAVFGVMAAAPQHTFQVLTKRAARMREWFAWMEERVERDAERWSAADCSVDIHTAREQCAVLACWDEAAKHLDRAAPEVKRATDWLTGEDTPRWPLPNVHLGVSVENQAAADGRIPELLRTPAAVRFLSCEPLLGPVDLAPYLVDDLHRMGRASRMEIDWVIAGCESGPGARPADVAWYRSIRDQCAAAGVAFFLKQAREDIEICDEGCGQPVRATVVDAKTATYGCGCTEEGAADGSPTGIQMGPGSHRKSAGIIGAPYLDGEQHIAFPEPRP